MPAAAVKSLQSCPTLCDPMDCSLPGSPIHGIFQARVLEWVAISFSSLVAYTPPKNLSILVCKDSGNPEEPFSPVAQNCINLFSRGNYHVGQNNHSGFFCKVVQKNLNELFGLAVHPEEPVPSIMCCQLPSFSLFQHAQSWKCS